jgi:TonB-dependent SusC/RagA subfamily outer membrane receptor
MKKILLFCTFTIYIGYRAFAQSYHAVDKLKNYFSIYDPEKTYLQFDRPFYAAGDTIFFKAYVTQGGDHKLSGLSGVLHVDLINTENKIDQSIKLRLDSGVSWGDFALPDSIPTGNYRIRAYTQWMLNLGKLDFFDQPILVGAIMKRSVPDSGTEQQLPAITNKPDIQFFPEGGTLVEGIQTKVAFKAIGKNGLAIDVNGVLVDKSNKQVGTFESSHLGMGYFTFLPEKDNVYKALLTFSDGSQNMVDLPKPEASGISLSVTNDSASAISISIKANSPYYQANRNKYYLVVIYSGGKAMTYSSKQEDLIMTLNIEKKVLQTGVVPISLFSEDGVPLCERLIFVQNNDHLALYCRADKTEYHKKEKISAVLNASGPTGLPVDGHFSMTVIDESKMPVNENNERNIATDLLLTSDLKGYVEEPNYYFNDTSQEARSNLDVLMLTQGYSNFEWKQVLGRDPAVLAFQPERGLEINGRITNLSDKPISNGTVMLIPSKGGPVISRKSDNKGFFHFSSLVFTDTTQLILSAVNSRGKNTTKITYINESPESPVVLSLPYAPPVMKDTGMVSYLGMAKKWHDEYYFDIGKGKLLKPVTVKAVKHDNQYRTQSLAGAGFADQVMHSDEIERIGGQLSTSLNGRLRGVNIYNGIAYLTSSIQNSGFSHRGASPMLLVLDGTVIHLDSNFNLDLIPPSQVETVEVLKYASASIYGMEGANGVLVITTKDASERYKDIESIGVLPIAPMGFYQARTFYSPKYDFANGNSPQPEFRPTIYWNPELRTDKDGNAIFDYYNAADAGTYKIIIEGMDSSGHIGRLVYRYKVE